MKYFLCDKCERPIKYRFDLVTVFSFFRIGLYHEECYAKAIKSWQTFFIDNHPINGTAGTFTSILLFLLGVVMTIVVDGFSFIFMIICTLPVFVRAYSWFRYERHLEP